MIKISKLGQLKNSQAFQNWSKISKRVKNSKSVEHSKIGQNSAELIKNIKNIDFKINQKLENSAKI